MSEMVWLSAIVLVLVPTAQAPEPVIIARLL
jgi:hypothetical protein